MSPKQSKPTAAKKNKLLSTSLFRVNVGKIAKEAIKKAEAGDENAAWQALKPLFRIQARNDQAALTIVRIVNGAHLSIEHALEALGSVLTAHPDNAEVIGHIGSAIDCARDLNFLNLAAPEQPFFDKLLQKLIALAEQAKGTQDEESLVLGVYSTARMMARQHDSICERSVKRLIEINPNSSNWHYNLGLFYKTRGRFREGMIANQKAASLCDEPSESIEWNMGICATGAREGQVALAIWKRMKNKLEMGRSDLPDGRYPGCKIRLAERPLAERSAAEDDPGLEETVWIERLSPCHGIIRSVLVQPLGVDYGDVILFDGAPITYHKYGDREIPVFPHLATLVRSEYRFFDFVGTQENENQLGDISEELERDAIVYSHTENYRVVCADCWRNDATDRQHKHNHTHKGDQNKRVVRGRIAAPPDLSPAALLKQIDSAIAKREPCRIFSPELCEAAGLTDRALFERRRFEMLTSGD